MNGRDGDAAGTCLDIDRLVPGGEGFGRLPDGRPVFVPGAFPGDRVRLGPGQDRGAYLRAPVAEVVRASPDRVEPGCPVADRCGGCDWMRLARPAQLGWKGRLLHEALGRTGGLRDAPGPVSVEGAGPPLGYRGRLRLHVDPAGRVGLFARGTHDLVEIPGCPVSAPAVEEGLRTVREAAEAAPGALAAMSGLEVRSAPEGVPLLLHFYPRERTARLPPPTRALLDRLATGAAVAVAGRGWPGGGDAGEQRWPLPGGATLVAPALAFTQVNDTVNRTLVQAVVDGALARRVDDFCDLYCGAGNFTLPLLRAGLAGVGVEASAAAVRAARVSAGVAGRESFVAGDAPREMRRLVHAGRRFDLVLLDPPRTGARGALPAVVDAAPRHVAYVSCDPVTLARDVRWLADAGYALTGLRAFDMFPQTHHVEALAWLERRG